MLRWRLLGISFSIAPSFWIMNFLWALLIYCFGMQRNDIGGFVWFAIIWTLCTLVAVMVHELGHVATARIFGSPGQVALAGMGGQTVGEYQELRPWQRIIVIANGPLAGLALIAVLAYFDSRWWNLLVDDWLNLPGLKLNFNFVARFGMLRFNPTYIEAMSLLFFLSLFMNVMNLFPIIPMDGGMIFKEICVLIWPRGGLRLAFICSFVLAIGATLYMLAVVLAKYRILPATFNLFYPFVFPELSLFMFAQIAHMCWKTYRQLGVAARHQQYRDPD